MTGRDLAGELLALATTLEAEAARLRDLAQTAALAGAAPSQLDQLRARHAELRLGLRVDDGLPSSSGVRSAEPVREVLTLAQAAELLGKCTKIVAKLAAQRKIPGRKVGHDWRFSRSALLEWMNHGNPQS